MPISSPLDIPNVSSFGLSKTAASFSLTGDLVDAWGDLGPAGHSFVASSTARPSRSGTLNGWPTVVFDGVDDLLSDASAPIGDPTTGAFSAWVLSKPTGSMSERIVLDQDGGSGDRIAQIMRYDGGFHTILFDTGGGNTQIKAGSPSTDVWYLTRTKTSGTAAELAVGIYGSTLSVIGTASPPSQRYSAGKNLTIGGSLFGNQYCFPGEIAAWLTVARYTTGTEDTDIEDWITAAFAVAGQDVPPDDRSGIPAARVVPLVSTSLWR